MSGRPGVRMVIAAVVLAALAALPLGADDQLTTAAIVGLQMIYVAQCWNICAGYAGLFSLGHSVFVGIGAYTSTLLMMKAGISPWFGALAGATLAAGFGALVAFVAFFYRVRGIAFAVLTLGSMQVAKGLASNWDWVGGAVGINLTMADDPANMLFMSRVPNYYIILALVVGVTLLIWRLGYTRLGQYMVAIREDEDAAEASGIDARRVKMQAMALSGGLTALAGTFYAQFYLFVTPDTMFVFDHQLNMLLGVMVGGPGTVLGPVFGSAFFSFCAEMLRHLPFDEGREVNTAAQMFYAVLLISVMIRLPGGLVSLLTRRRRRTP
jgi:branched-chain amino acid transport system permease protein